MFYHKLALSSGPTEAADAFYQDYQNWVRGCVHQYRHFPPADSPRQTALVQSWFFLLKQICQEKADSELMDFVTRMRDKMQLHFEVSGLWKHGYWRFADVRDGTFYFERFLKYLWEVAPDDTVTTQTYLVAARNLGNWRSMTPDWFNAETSLFYSYFLGTEAVRDEPQYRVNVIEHFRLLSMALTAFRMSGDKQYLEWAKLYGGKWAKAIIAKQELPVGLSEEGPVYSLNGTILEAYNQFIGETTTLQDELERAESFLTNDAIRILLDLWQFTEDTDFQTAATKLLDILVLHIPDPDAGAVAAAIRTYRNLTGSNRYDDRVLEHVESSFPYCIETIAMETSVERDVRPYGVGKDRFLPVWFENNYPRQHSPILLGLAAEICGNERLATRALDLARGYFAIARMAFENDGFDGHIHAQSIGSIAAGHRRDNGAGMITAVLEPLTEVFAS